jgi:hypothetical protein
VIRATLSACFASIRLHLRKTLLPCWPARLQDEWVAPERKHLGNHLMANSLKKGFTQMQADGR